MPELLRAVVHLRVHEGAERRVLADVAELLADAEEDEARALRPAHLEALEELGEAEREELAVQVAHELVQVREGQRDGRGLAVDGADAA